MLLQKAASDVKINLNAVAQEQGRFDIVTGALEFLKAPLFDIS